MLRIIGDQITGIKADRKEVKRGIQIKNNLKTDKIYRKTFFLGSEQEGLVFVYT